MDVEAVGIADARRGEEPADLGAVAVDHQQPGAGRGQRGELARGAGDALPLGGEREIAARRADRVAAERDHGERQRAHAHRRARSARKASTSEPSVGVPESAYPYRARTTGLRGATSAARSIGVPDTIASASARSSVSARPAS